MRHRYQAGPWMRRKASAGIPRGPRVAHVEAAEQQDGLLDARGAQLDAFFNRGDAEPVDAAGREALGDGHRAVTVSVGLDDGHHPAASRAIADLLVIAS